ncbi:hypothetical protein D3C75_1043530 [compost metagenome]
MSDQTWPLDTVPSGFVVSANLAAADFAWDPPAQIAPGITDDERDRAAPGVYQSAVPAAGFGISVLPVKC